MGDYLSLMQTEIDFEHPKVPVKAKELSSALGSTLAMPLRAVRDAPLAPGSDRFPVVIYAPGANDPAWGNADLCEYLASYGYVIIASPSHGANSRRMTMDVGGANMQAADISFLIGYAQTLPNTNTSKVAVVGMSWGGLASLVAAARDSRIGALVSLEGSMRYFPHIVQQAEEVHPEQMTIPLLAFAQRDFSLEDGDHYLSPENRGGPSVLNKWTHGDLIAVHMMDLSHAEFNSISINAISTSWWEASDHVYPLAQADYGRADAMTGYGWVARYTVRFLDAYLKNDIAAMAFLKKESCAEPNVPPHVTGSQLSLRHRAVRSLSSPSVPELGRRELQSPRKSTPPDFQAQDSKFELDEGLMTDWSDELLADNHSSEALILLKLNLKAHPDSSNAYRSLGNAYRVTARPSYKTAADDNYRAAVAKDPLNAEARRKLADLSTHKNPPRH